LLSLVALTLTNVRPQATSHLYEKGPEREKRGSERERERERERARERARERELEREREGGRERERERKEGKLNYLRLGGRAGNV
jgi:hypothetical protein